jgi:hypothetical protein
MAGTEDRSVRGDRRQVRRRLAGLGPPQDRSDDACRQPSGVHLDGAASALTGNRGRSCAGRCSATRQRKRNRVWQADFSEFETGTGGIWRICAIIDYATKYCLTVTVSRTARGPDAVACLRKAIAEAERLCGDLRADRGVMTSWTPTARSSGRRRRRSRSCLTTGRAFVARCSPRSSPTSTVSQTVMMIRCCGTSGRG